MRITFLGAAERVTGSRFLLEAAGKRILVDCGLFQGLKNYDNATGHHSRSNLPVLTRSY